MAPLVSAVTVILDECEERLTRVKKWADQGIILPTEAATAKQAILSIAIGLNDTCQPEVEGAFFSYIVA